MNNFYTLLNFLLIAISLLIIISITIYFYYYLIKYCSNQKYIPPYYIGKSKLKEIDINNLK